MMNEVGPSRILGVEDHPVQTSRPVQEFHPELPWTGQASHCHGTFAMKGALCSWSSTVLVFEFGPPIPPTSGAPVSGRGEIYIYFPRLWGWHCCLLLPTSTEDSLGLNHANSLNCTYLTGTLMTSPGHPPVPLPTPGCTLLKMNFSEQNILWSVQQNTKGP